MTQLKRTPLYNEHVALNAKLAPFGDWEMPIEYSGIMDERKSCRAAAVVFDTCHMGEFYFKGDIASSGIEYPFCFSIETIPVGRCRYGFLLNDAGGIIDDLIVYRLAVDELMIVVNAGTIEKDFDAIKTALNKNALFENRSSITSKLDIQGPASRDALRDIAGSAVDELKYFTFTHTTILGERALISRTGYTGELGFEIYISNDRIVELWNLLIRKYGVIPAGLGARDLLRLEVGYSLYGHELSDTITPLEAGLEGYVNFDKDFHGKEALSAMKEKGAGRIKVAFMTNSRRSPRAHYTIFADGKSIGEVTSGIFTPVTNTGIGLGLVANEHARIGNKIAVGNETISIDAEIVELPFYKNGTARK